MLPVPTYIAIKEGRYQASNSFCKVGYQVINVKSLPVPYIFG
jgi:hypothetical protein